MIGVRDSSGRATPGRFGARIGALLLACGAAFAEPGSEETREEFRSAYYEATTGARLQADGDSTSLRAYSLYPYLEAARIKKALTLIGADARGWVERADDFLVRFDRQPAAAGLERAVLQSMARRGRMDEFMQRYRPGIANSRLQCQWLSARIARDDLSGLAADILDRWRTPSQLPIECEPAFQWLRDEGLLGADETEERLRLLLQAGQGAFARVIARQLPAQRAEPWLIWADLVESPRIAIDALIERTALQVEAEALLDGWGRLSRNAPAMAAERYEGLAQSRLLSTEDVSLAARALAFGLAWDRDPRALEYFDRVSASHVDDYTLEWIARAALWAGEWPRVAQAIDSMSTGQQQLSVWRYWNARAAEALADEAGARAAYESLAGDDNYYSAMAAARLGILVEPAHDPLPRNSDTVEAISGQMPMIRARELLAVDMPDAAVAEWQFALGDLDDADEQQAIHLAADWSWYDVAVATATSHGIFYDYELLYPKPFDRAVNRAARQTRLDAPLVYGLIRQESLYRAEAVSSAGAIGLTQLIPSTAEITARQWELDRPSRGELLEPDVNILLGAAHLRSLIERFGGQLAVALSAYNAGPLPAQRWLPEQPVDTDIWIENIPYNETRAYVRRVLWHSLVFKWLDDRQPQDTSTWVDTIARPANR